MEKSIQNVPISPWLMLAAIVALLVALAAPVLYLVAPALCAAVLVRRNRMSALLLMLMLPVAAVVLLRGGCVPMLGGASMDGLISGLCLVALGVLPALAIGQMQMSGRGGFASAAAATACCTAALYCALCLPGVVSGAGAFTAVEQVMAESAAQLEQLLLSVQTAETAVAIGLYLENLARLESSVSLLLVPVICLFGCVLGLSNTLLFYALTRRDRAALGLSPMKPFALWDIPRSVTTGLFVLLIGSFVLMLAGAEYAEAVNATVTVLVGFPLTVQALALIDFLLQSRPRRLALKRTVAYVAAALLLPVSLSLFITLGCFEQLFHIREKIMARRAQQQFPPEDGEEGGA